MVVYQSPTFIGCKATIEQILGFLADDIKKHIGKRVGTVTWKIEVTK